MERKKKHICLELKMIRIRQMQTIGMPLMPIQIRHNQCCGSVTFIREAQKHTDPTDPVPKHW